jgi:DNA polymerase-3 subunit alpha
MAGYSLGKADLLRKAMGKKDAKLMADQKREFLKGSDAKGIDRKISEEVFHQIETFARYGFNRAHSASYAYIAYQTAWLKCYYPRQFMAALMTSEINNTDQIYKLKDEAEEMGIRVLPPDVNESKLDFTVVEGSIRFGLQAVKNVGEGPALAIARERMANGRFTSLADLVSRVPPGAMNRRTLESLIAAGAGDSLGGHRAQKYAAVEKMIEFGRTVFSQTSSHDLFASKAGVIDRVAPELPQTEEWSQGEMLVKEKEALGFYISGHPLRRYRVELTEFAQTTTVALKEAPDGRETTLAGVVAKVRRQLDKKGNMYAFVTLEDLSGSADILVFSDCFEKNRDILQPDRIVLVRGNVSTREGKPTNLVAAEIVPLENLPERFSCQLVIKITGDCPETTIDKALTLLEGSAGPSPVMLTAAHNGSEVFIRSKRYSVSVNLDLLNRLKELLGDTAAVITPAGHRGKFS